MFRLCCRVPRVSPKRRRRTRRPAAAWAGWTTDRPIERRQGSATRPCAEFVAQCSEGAESFRPRLGGQSHAKRGLLLQGVALGAFATLGIGFSWGGFMLGSTAKTLADSTANSAVVAAIAPICVDQFQRSTDAANNLTALKKTDAWQQAAYVEKGGWAVMP